MLPPDLFVADLTRARLESVVEDLLDRGVMPPGYLVVCDDSDATDGRSGSRGHLSPRLPQIPA
jgi:hypothetical protein